MTAYGAPKAPDGTTKEWDEWTDVLGQTYRADDVIAYASISGKSPQLVIARVLRINRVNSKGQEITEQVWDTPNGRHERGAERKTIPYCSLTVMPLIDARNFWRSSNPKAVTLSIPQNIIKVDAALIEAMEAKTIADLQAMKEDFS